MGACGPSLGRAALGATDSSPSHHSSECFKGPLETRGERFGWFCFLAVGSLLRAHFAAAAAPKCQLGAQTAQASSPSGALYCSK